MPLTMSTLSARAFAFYTQLDQQSQFSILASSSLVINTEMSSTGDQQSWTEDDDLIANAARLCSEFNAMLRPNRAATQSMLTLRPAKPSAGGADRSVSSSGVLKGSETSKGQFILIRQFGLTEAADSIKFIITSTIDYKVPKRGVPDRHSAKSDPTGADCTAHTQSELGERLHAVTSHIHSDGGPANGTFGNAMRKTRISADGLTKVWNLRVDSKGWHTEA